MEKKVEKKPRLFKSGITALPRYPGILCTSRSKQRQGRALKNAVFERAYCVDRSAFIPSSGINTAPF